MRRGRTLRALLMAGCAALTAAPSVSAQLIELNGGLSSAYQAEGGTVTLHGRGYEMQLGAGIVAGRAVGGAEVAYRYHSADLLLGTEQLRLNLPTDLFNDYHRLVGVGATVRKETVRSGTVGGETVRSEIKEGMHLEVFAGETSDHFDTPLFEGIRAEKPAGAILLEKSLRPNLRMFTQAVYASKLSVIESLAWKPRPDTEVALSAGLGSGAHYGAASVDMKRPRFDLKAAYIDVGSHFARTGSQSNLSPEPIRENLLFTWRSRGDARVTLTGGRQNSLVSNPNPKVSAASVAALPEEPSSISTLDQISGSFRLERTAFTASLLQSSYKGAGNLSFAVAASRTISREMRVQASYYESHPRGPGTGSVNRTIVANVQRELSSRITASGTATVTNGQTNLSLGGSILSNLGTLSADYQTFYVPTRPGNPFQQALVLDLQVNLLGRLTAHAASFMGATGKLLYTFDLHASQAFGGAVAPTVTQHVNLGACVLKGRVVDQASNPVEGAALSIDGKMVLTDSDGRFFMRDKKPQVHTYEILLNQFLDGGSWHTVSPPQRMESTRETPVDVVLIVERSGGVLDPAGPSPSEVATSQPAPAPPSAPVAPAVAGVSEKPQVSASASAPPTLASLSQESSPSPPPAPVAPALAAVSDKPVLSAPAPAPPTLATRSQESSPAPPSAPSAPSLAGLPDEPVVSSSASGPPTLASLSQESSPAPPSASVTPSLAGVSEKPAVSAPASAPPTVASLSEDSSPAPPPASVAPSLAGVFDKPTGSASTTGPPTLASMSEDSSPALPPALVAPSVAGLSGVSDTPALSAPATAPPTVASLSQEPSPAPPSAPVAPSVAGLLTEPTLSASATAPPTVAALTQESSPAPPPASDVPFLAGSPSLVVRTDKPTLSASATASQAKMKLKLRTKVKIKMKTAPPLQVALAPLVAPAQPRLLRAEKGHSGDAGTGSRFSRAKHLVVQAASWLYAQVLHWLGWESKRSDGKR